MKSILEDIKTQNFKQAYLLYGEEAYLKHQYKNKLKNALLPEDDTMNFSRFEGKGTEIPKVIDLAETMPFFADRRVILLENTGFFKNKAETGMKPKCFCFAAADTKIIRLLSLLKEVIINLSKSCTKTRLLCRAGGQTCFCAEILPEKRSNRNVQEQ